MSFKPGLKLELSRRVVIDRHLVFDDGGQYNFDKVLLCLTAVEQGVYMKMPKDIYAMLQDIAAIIPSPYYENGERGIIPPGPNFKVVRMVFIELHDQGEAGAAEAQKLCEAALDKAGL